MNILDRQIIEDGWKHAIVKLTGVLDTSDISEAPAIALSDFTNNDTMKEFNGLCIKKISWSIGDGLQIVLAWNGFHPQQIAPLSGRGKLCAKDFGSFNPDMTLIGYDGGINLTTSGYPMNTVQNFVVVLEMTKRYD